jgi:hypothetical protein
MSSTTTTSLQIPNIPISGDIGDALEGAIQSTLNTYITKFTDTIKNLKFIQDIINKIKRFDDNYTKRSYKILNIFNFLIISALFYLSYLHVPTVILAVINIILTAILFHYFKKL